MVTQNRRTKWRPDSNQVIEVAAWERAGVADDLQPLGCGYDMGSCKHFPGRTQLRLNYHGENLESAIVEQRTSVLGGGGECDVSKSSWYLNRESDGAKWIRYEGSSAPGGHAPCQNQFRPPGSPAAGESGRPTHSRSGTNAPGDEPGIVYLAHRMIRPTDTEGRRVSIIAEIRKPQNRSRTARWGCNRAGYRLPYGVSRN